MTIMLRTLRILPAALLAFGLVLSLVSCTENQPATPKSDLNLKAILPDDVRATQNQNQVVMSSPGALTAPARSEPLAPPIVSTGPLANAAAQPAPVKPAAPKEDVFIPPADAKWTIFCTVIGGTGHMERAKQLKTRLAQTTGSSKWYVVHDDEKSTIYYGYYRSIERGTREGDTAQADRQSIAKLKNASGEAPLALCSFMLIDRPAPQAPAEWDLASFPRNPQHFWSLQIAAYTADATDDQGHDRKWAAVESVRSLRAQGIPAYYFHGDAISSVCVGLWAENAVKRQSGDNGSGNAGNMNPDEELLVINQPLPAGVTPRSPDGHRLKTMTPRFEPIDESMIEMARKFPLHYTNNAGVIHKKKNARTGEIVDVPEPSFWVMVPEAKLSTAVAPTGSQQTPANANQPLPLLPPAMLGTDNRLPPQPGVGRLREVGQ